MAEAAQSARHPRHGDGRHRAHARRVRHTRTAPGRSARLALGAAWSAASLGIASATVSAYWALGGTSLLDTVGGEIERWGRERSGGVVATLWLITAAKLVIAIAPLVMTGIGERHLPRWTTARWTRLLCWLIALGLTFYGGLLSAAGLLVEAGLLDSVADDADRRALTWHTYLWDPWFALWGAAFTVTMWRTRTTRAPGAGSSMTGRTPDPPPVLVSGGAGTTGRRVIQQLAIAGEPPMLELVGLYKSFGDVVAVDHVDLVAPAGSFYGLVGPNGAGKSSVLAMAVGLLRPDAGVSRVGGFDVWTTPGPARAQLGVLPDGLALTERLTARELLTFHGRLRGLDPAVVAERVDDLLALMDVRDAERTLVVDYSTGMRKKVGLATALLHAPRLLVLDEPFEAVDPVSAATLKSILTTFVDGGGTVVLSSHVMSLVEQLCDSMAVMAGGRVIAAGTLDEVRGATTLEQAFISLVGADDHPAVTLPWL